MVDEGDEGTHFVQDESRSVSSNEPFGFAGEVSKSSSQSYGCRVEFTDTLGNTLEGANSGETGQTSVIEIHRNPDLEDDFTEYYHGWNSSYPNIDSEPNLQDFVN